MLSHRAEGMTVRRRTARKVYLYFEFLISWASKDRSYFPCLCLRFCLCNAGAYAYAYAYDYDYAYAHAYANLNAYAYANA